MVGGLAGCLGGTDWIPNSWFKVQDSEYIRGLAKLVADARRRDDKRSTAPFVVSERRIKALRQALVDGQLNNLELDGIRKAQVVDDFQPSSLSETTATQTWSLRAEDGQTIYVSKFARIPRANLRSQMNRQTDMSAQSTGHQVPQVVGVKVAVRDVAKAVRFYQSAFGVSLTSTSRRMATFDAISLIELQYARQLSDGALRASATTKGILLAVRVSRLEDVLSRIEQAGGRVTKDIFTAQNGERLLYCLDVDGNLIEVSESS